MQLVAMGLNHKTASIGLREQLAVNQEQLLETISDLMHAAHLKAAVLVSTCNRTELYFEASSITSVLKWLQQRQKISLGDLLGNAYIYRDLKAVKHLMQVASGLDSMVLGEVEILGQMKSAYQLALSQGYVNKTLSRLFQTAFSVAKKVRTQTDIGLNPVSVAYLAVRLANRIFAKIEDQVVLIIGAGDTARLLTKYLVGAGVKKFYIANRTMLRARAMALELGLQDEVELLSLGMIPEYLAQVDIVVAATSSPLPLVGKGMVESAMKQRKHKPMFMIDLAVPRDIEVQVREISDVYLYGLEELQNIAAEHQRYRHNAALQAELIIEHEAEKFALWLKSQHSVSTIQALRAVCEEKRKQCLVEAQRQLDAGRDPKEVLERFGNLLLNRILHQPTVQMRLGSKLGNTELLSVVRELFNLRADTKQKEESLINL